MVEASASVRVVIGSGSDGATGGGRITGPGCTVGGCDVEPPASFGANNAEMNCAQLAAYSAIVNGGAGPHDLIVGAPNDSSVAGASAAARRRQKM
jgi:hypothetical protein